MLPDWAQAGSVPVAMPGILPVRSCLAFIAGFVGRPAEHFSHIGQV
jgi:hypothetical protein